MIKDNKLLKQYFMHVYNLKIIFRRGQSMEFSNHLKNGARPAKPAEQGK
jgi:hypothetical protein